MIFLLVSIAFISLTALVFRWSADRGADPLGVNAVFRVFGGVVALTVLLPGLSLAVFRELPAAVWGWSLAGGVFYWLAGYANLRASGLGHLGITWTVSRSAMVLPSLASMVIWQEISLSLTTPQLWLGLAGLLLTLVALVAFGLDRMRKQADAVAAKPGWGLWLVLSFLLQGSWELTLRASGAFPQEEWRGSYICIVFLLAMVLSLGALAWRGQRPGRLEWGFGLLAGIGTVVGTGIRPWALRDLPGLLVFPATAVGVILLTQAASALIWKDRLGRWGYLGVAAAMVGVVVLGLLR